MQNLRSIVVVLRIRHRRSFHLRISVPDYGEKEFGRIDWPDRRIADVPQPFTDGSTFNIDIEHCPNNARGSDRAAEPKSEDDPNDDHAHRQAWFEYFT